MKTDRTEYLAPEFEVLEVMVEQGFANSMEDPFENDEMEW